MPDLRWVAFEDEPRLLEQFSSQRVEWEFAGLDAAAWGRPDHLSTLRNRRVGKSEAAQQDVVIVRDHDGPDGPPPLSLGSLVLHLDRLRAWWAPGLPRSVAVMRDCPKSGVTGSAWSPLVGREGLSVNEESMPGMTTASTTEQDRELARELVAKARTDGLDLVGPDGLLTGLTKRVLETALEEELTDHLG